MNLEEVILKVVRRAPSALTFPQLARAARLEAETKVKKPDLESALDQLVEGGQLRRVEGLSKGKNAVPAFTVLNDTDLAAALLEPRLGNGSKPVKVVSLKSKLPAALAGEFDGAMKALLEREDAFELPHKPGFVLARKPRPSDVVEGAKAKSIRALLDQANQLRPTAKPRTLEDFLAWLDEDCGPGAATGAENESAPLDSALPPLTPELLREWYGADAAHSASRMIPIPATWLRYERWANENGIKADSQRLRRIMDFLYKEGQIWLEPCDRPQELAESEQALLVPMSLGPPGYYWCWSE